VNQLRQQRKTSPHEQVEGKVRLAFVGVGSELNGDDAADLWVVRALNEKTGGSSSVLCFESGGMLENALGPLRRFHPDGVVVIDAADFGGEPGAARLIELTETAGFSFSTHSLPLGTICAYLSQELECPVWILGIQPLHLDFDAPMSPELQQTAGILASDLFTLINNKKGIT
jgi:hydrogenase 3 maturation protease